MGRGVRAYFGGLNDASDSIINTSNREAWHRYLENAGVAATFVNTFAVDNFNVQHIQLGIGGFYR